MSTMNSLEMINRLGLAIIRNERHPYYQHTVNKTQLYRKILTGVGMESLMIQFNRREDLAMFKQRVDITQHITKTVSVNIKDIYAKIPRSNSVQRVIAYLDNDHDKLKEFNSLIDKFWGKSSLDDYMNTRWFDLNFIDPNAFIVLEWGEFDNKKERARPYPFEVYSESAIYYEYVDNILDFLITLTTQSVWVESKNGTWTEKTYEVYTMYGKNQTVQFVEEIDESVILSIRNIAATGNMKTMNGVSYFKPDRHNDKVYRVIEFKKHNLGFVPAEQVGVLYDLETNGNTYVSPLDKGIPILMKLIKANSEFDLTMALHAFPQKLQHVRKCAATDCRDGKRIDGTVCPVCNGEGTEVIKSAQEMITIPLPKSKEDMIDLGNIVKYIYPPVDLVKFQENYIEILTYQVKEAIFNTELFSRQQIAETATGKNISLQNVYDALYPIALGYSDDWSFFVNAVAKITDLHDGLIAFYTFSKDFKLKSLSDLYIDLKMVGDARASDFVKSQIEDDIAAVMFSENPRELQRYKVHRSFYPFSGKTAEQINTIIASNLTTEHTRVFWANFSLIFDEVEIEQSMKGVDFYYLSKEKQYELLDAKVKEFIERVKAEKPETMIEPENPFGENPVDIE